MSALDGKVAIVTGASAGIGVATARRLHAAGATVILVARRQERLDALTGELGARAVPLVLDLATEEAADRLFDFAQQQFGHADVLVNNAGILRVGTLEAFDLAQLRSLVALNYESIVRSSYLFARSMRARGSGQIINISSIGAHLNAAGSGVYGGLKRALEAFTDSLRIELAGSGVKVGLIAPGTTSTEIFDDMKAHGQPGWDDYIPALDPDDVARAVQFIVEQPARANTARIHVYSASETF